MTTKRPHLAALAHAAATHSSDQASLDLVQESPMLSAARSDRCAVRASEPDCDGSAMFGYGETMPWRQTMRIGKADAGTAKGWSFGPWNTKLGMAIGWATAAIDEPHLHRRVTEIYLVGRGAAEARIEREAVWLEPGDILVVEPGEAHTFTDSSPDYLHFVLHLPALPQAEAQADKVPISRQRLGLDG